MHTKQCGKCRETKEISEFYKSKRGSYCKVCHTKSSAESRERNKQKRIEQWLESPTHSCKRCGQEKPNDSFYWKSNRTYCKDCTQEINDDWYTRNKESVDEYRNEWRRDARKKDATKWLSYELKQRCKRFGTTVEWYESQTIKQNGRCAICGKIETARHQKGSPVSLSIDHNHATGKVRGLLCRLCNHALHNLDRDPQWPYKAVAYLTEYD